MSETLKVEGSDNLIRVMDSKAIVNNSYEDFRLAAKIKADKLAAISRLNTLEQEMGEIKSMLNELLVLMNTKETK